MKYDSSKEFQKIEEKRFNLVKDLTILAATVFGMSVALAIGKQGNAYFIIGELFLFLSLVSGIVFLYSVLRGEEFFHYMMTESELKFSLKKKTGGPEDFLIDAQEDLIRQYGRLKEKSSKGFVAVILRFIKIDYFYPMFFIFFLLGTFLVFLSLNK